MAEDGLSTGDADQLGCPVPSDHRRAEPLQCQNARALAVADPVAQRIESVSQSRSQARGRVYNSCHGADPLDIVEDVGQRGRSKRHE